MVYTSVADQYAQKLNYGALKMKLVFKSSCLQTINVFFS